jgi:hypothetical protein
MCGYLSSVGKSITPTMLQTMAYNYAHLNEIDHPFSADTQRAGRDWTRRFLKRNRENLVIKKSTNIAKHRAICANEKTLSSWFSNYHDLIVNQLEINNGSNIWNVDETGLQNVPKQVMVLGKPRQKAYTIVSGDKGVTTTLLTYGCASGLVCPPMIIFKGGKNVHRDIIEAAPRNWVIRQSETGYVNATLFHEYGTHFLEYLKEKKLYSSKKNVVLLDNHSSHLYNPEYIRAMRDAGVRVWTFPSHVTHVLQPLDNAPFSALKRYWERGLHKWNFDHNGERLGKARHFFDVLVPAFEKAMSRQNVSAAFETTGMWPVNRTKLKASDIGPSLTTADPKYGNFVWI